MQWASHSAANTTAYSCSATQLKHITHPGTYSLVLAGHRCDQQVAAFEVAWLHQHLPHAHLHLRVLGLISDYKASKQSREEGSIHEMHRGPHHFDLNWQCQHVCFTMSCAASAICQVGRGADV